MTATTKPTTLRRHLWTLRRLAEICEQNGLPAPKVQIEYDGKEMDAQWYSGLMTEPSGPEGFRKVMAAFPDLKWKQNGSPANHLDGSYDANYFRIRATWDVDGGLPLDLEVWTTRPGFPFEQFADLPVKGEED